MLRMIDYINERANASNVLEYGRAEEVIVRDCQATVSFLYLSELSELQDKLPMVSDYHDC